MARRLIWSNLVEFQKKEIYKYWNQRNKSNEYSRKLDLLFTEVAELLLKKPLIGTKTSRKDVRLIIVRDYLMFYKVTRETIQILIIWDSRRDPQDLKELTQKL